MKELQIIQAKLKAPKGQYNSFGKYKYRSAEDILEAVKPLYIEQNCVLTISDSIELIGQRYYVKATARLTNSEGVSVESSAYAREDLAKKGMDESQITGSTSSYARKYALNGLFAIDDNKDPDFTNTHEKQGSATTTTHQNVQTETNVTVKSLEDVINKCMLAKSNNELLNIHKEYYESGIYKTAELLKALSERKTQLQNLESL